MASILNFSLIYATSQGSEQVIQSNTVKTIILKKIIIKPSNTKCFLYDFSNYNNCNANTYFNSECHNLIFDEIKFFC